MARRAPDEAGLEPGPAVSPALKYAAISEAVEGQHLEILGGFEADPEDDVGAATVMLLGPREPGFWEHLKSSPEGNDGLPDPLDRWSKRVIGELAEKLGGQAVFPFGGPPYHPFIEWALRTGRTWVSPVTLLVNDVQGMMVSFRGALLFGSPVAAPRAVEAPCISCNGQPCRTACPVDALKADRYDVDVCKAHVASAAGRECREGGCLVRRACPVSKTYGRVAAQSAHHMEYFL